MPSTPLVPAFRLSPTEIACGVTIEQVRETRGRSLVREDRVFIPLGTAPALAGAVARCAIGDEVVLAGMNSLRVPVYRRALEHERRGAA